MPNYIEMVVVPGEEAYGYHIMNDQDQPITSLFDTATEAGIYWINRWGGQPRFKLD